MTDLTVEAVTRPYSTQPSRLSLSEALRAYHDRAHTEPLAHCSEGSCLILRDAEDQRGECGKCAALTEMVEVLAGHVAEIESDLTGEVGDLPERLRDRLESFDRTMEFYRADVEPMPNGIAP